MSVMEEVRERIVERLKELEPARAEYDELVAAAKSVGADYEPDHHALAAGAGRARRTARSDRKIAPPGQRRQQMLDAIAAQPGITVAEVAEKLGLDDATSLYRVQRQLVKEQVVRKEDAKMFMAN